MNPHNSVLFLLSAIVMATAVPLSDLDKELEAFVQVLNGVDVRFQHMQVLVVWNADS